jgi:hypothetical protein
VSVILFFVSHLIYFVSTILGSFRFFQLSYLVFNNLINPFYYIL